MNRRMIVYRVLAFCVCVRAGVFVSSSHFCCAALYLLVRLHSNSSRGLKKIKKCRRIGAQIQLSTKIVTVLSRVQLCLCILDESHLQMQKSHIAITGGVFATPLCYVLIKKSCLYRACAVHGSAFSAAQPTPPRRVLCHQAFEIASEISRE